MRSRAAILAAAAVVAVLGAECAVRAYYWAALVSGFARPIAYEAEYWPAPPWARFASIFTQDPELGQWCRPNLARRYANLFGPIRDLREVRDYFAAPLPSLRGPDWARDRPVWTLATNRLGLRGPEPRTPKPADAFRVVVLGDSWTVGVNVENEDSYPARLEALLAAACGRRRCEVVNYGVIGAGARTGLRLMRGRIAALRPDVVVVAYAQNDLRRFTDHPRPGPDEPPSVPAGGIGERLEAWKLYRYWRSSDESARERLLSGALRRELGRADNEAPGPCADPSAREGGYARDVTGIVDAARAAGAEPILLHNNLAFMSQCAGAALRAVAASRGVALIDAAPLLFERERALALEAQRRRGLGDPASDARRAGDGTARLLFRVEVPAAAARGGVRLTGDAPALGGFVPNKVPLFDDGTHGDQAAGDGVWSRELAVPAGGDVVYLYGTGGEGRWEGIENYFARKHRVRGEDAGRMVALPLQRYGERSLRSDPYHPDGEGHALIARALLEKIVRGAAFRAAEN